jgi:hypothetical protein
LLARAHGAKHDVGDGTQTGSQPPARTARARPETRDNEDGARLATERIRVELGRPAATYFILDVLAIEGLATTMLPYRQRREVLEQLELERPGVRLVATFEDGQALFDAVCARGLEGVVAKRTGDRYRPGARGWVKAKNRDTARFAEEHAGELGRAALGDRHHLAPWLARETHERLCSASEN